MPSGLADRAEVLRWMLRNASHVEKAIFGIALEKWFKVRVLKRPPDAARLAEHTEDVARFGRVLSEHLRPRTWVLGDRFTIADIAIGTSVDLTGPADISLAAPPGLAAWFARLRAPKSCNA